MRSSSRSVSDAISACPQRRAVTMIGASCSVSSGVSGVCERFDGWPTVAASAPTLSPARIFAVAAARASHRCAPARQRNGTISEVDQPENRGKLRPRVAAAASGEDRRWVNRFSLRGRRMLVRPDSPCGHGPEAPGQKGARTSRAQGRRRLQPSTKWPQPGSGDRSGPRTRSNVTVRIAQTSNKRHRRRGIADFAMPLPRPSESDHGVSVSVFGTGLVLVSVPTRVHGLPEVALESE